MTAVYLFSLILGAGFLLLSLLGGEGTDVDVDFDMDMDADVGGGDTAAFKIFSFRGLVYGAFGFGATGFIAELTGAGTSVTLAAAIVGGIASGAMITGLFNWLGRTESGGLPGERSLEGRTGRVMLPIAPTSAGSISVERGGRQFTLRALPHPTAEGDPESWTEVMIIEVRDGVARVTPAADLDLVD